MAISLEAQVMTAPTLDEILSRHGLQMRDVSRECSQGIRYEISIKIISWKMIGRLLGIPEETLVAIQVDNNTEDERRFVMLHTWHKKQGSQATYFRLMTALYRHQCCDLIELLCGMIKSHTAIVTQPESNSNGSEMMVKANLKELEERFFGLRHQLKSELLRRNIPVEAILESLTLLPMELKLEYDELVQAKLPQIETAITITELVYRLDPLFTFIDYNLLNYLASKFGSVQLKADMSSYIEHVQVFMRETTVGDVMPHWPGRKISSDEFSELWIKIKANPKSCTLQKLQEFRDKHCATIKLSAVLSSIKSLIPASSFFIVLLVPTATTIKVAKAIDFYREEQVHMVVLDNKLLYLSDSTDQMAEVPKYQFKSVHLLKDQSLGIGSYGAVCKAKCDDLLCAAKIIHPTLFDPTALQQAAPQREHRLPIRRFEQECEFMSAIRHPNIVQYLGMFRDTDTRLSVLLMELMDDSLTHFLESSTQPIPYQIQVNICHDVSLALSFLHSNNIIHRDLSSNNVLLRGNILAKVNDFGMARLGDINPQATRFTNTMCPGTDVYMPPEAVQDKPVYTEKIDCFSFGVIIVQTLTRQFPKPGDRLERVGLNHPGLRKRSVLVEVSEIDRRQNHISQVDPNHPLLPIALDCLKDEGSERPSAHQLCERVADLKGMPKYRDSARIVKVNRDEVIRSQATSMEEKDPTIISSKEEEIQQLRQQIREKDQTTKQQLEEGKRQIGVLNEKLRQLQLVNDQNAQQNKVKDRQLQEKERQLGRVNQQLEASEQVIAQFERRIVELEQQLSQRGQQKTSSRGKERINLKLRWRNGRRAPCGMNRWCDAVVDGNTVYVLKDDTVNIYSYYVRSDRWSQLPDCVRMNCSIAVINGWLTTIGGGSYPNYYNDLFSLTRKGIGRRWTQQFPPMPTKRESTTSLGTKTALIVAGGFGEGGGLSTVEVLNTETHQWSTAADLPQPMYTYHASATVCGDQLYMLGGANDDNIYVRSAYTCSVSALLQSCVPSSLEAKIQRTSLEDKAGVWRQVADVPVTQSTCESFHGRLLAVGGETGLGASTTAVYMYNSTTNSWEIISHMTTGRYSCFTAVLPDNRLMIVGGYIEHGSTDSVELATLCDD